MVVIDNNFQNVHTLEEKKIGLQNRGGGGSQRVVAVGGWP
jgi:hypothetical protein